MLVHTVVSHTQIQFQKTVAAINGTSYSTCSSITHTFIHSCSSETVAAQDNIIHTHTQIRMSEYFLLLHLNDGKFLLVFHL